MQWLQFTLKFCAFRIVCLVEIQVARQRWKISKRDINTWKCFTGLFHRQRFSRYSHHCDKICVSGFGANVPAVVGLFRPSWAWVCGDNAWQRAKMKHQKTYTTFKDLKWVPISSYSTSCCPLAFVDDVLLLFFFTVVLSSGSSRHPVETTAASKEALSCDEDLMCLSHGANDICLPHCCFLNIQPRKQ